MLSDFLLFVIGISLLIPHSGFLIRHYYSRVGSYPTRSSEPVFYGVLFEVFPGIIIYEVDAAVARVFAREESPSRTGQGDG